MIKQAAKSHKVDYVFSMLVNIILLIIFYKLPDWHLKFLKDSAIAAILLFVLNFFAQILGNTILLIYDRIIFRNIILIFLAVISIMPMYALYLTYPFDFSAVSAPSWTDLMVKIFIILSMMGVVITIIVEIVKIFQISNISILKFVSKERK
jgi:hypothetical protein